MKKVYFDIGELGWALYLSAIVRDKDVLVFTNRDCLFNCETRPVPKEFYDKFGHIGADGFGRRRVVDGELRAFLEKFVPDGYELAKDFKYDCWWGWNKGEKFKPYPYKNIHIKRNIMVFPRYRTSPDHAYRNLPIEFYEELITMLCNKYPMVEILSVGSKDGAYDIKSPYENYRNLVGKTTIQDIVDLSRVCYCAIGGQSAPPKITSLQGVPTYVIGHEKKRYTRDENWSNSKLGFYEIEPAQYNNLKFTREICDKIKEFIDDTIKLNTPDRQE